MKNSHKAQTNRLLNQRPTANNKKRNQEATTPQLSQRATPVPFPTLHPPSQTKSEKAQTPRVKRIRPSNQHRSTPTTTTPAPSINSNPPARFADFPSPPRESVGPHQRTHNAGKERCRFPRAEEGPKRSKAHHTTAGIGWWSATQLLICRLQAELWDGMHQGS